MATLARQHFFTEIVHKQEWKDSMAGKNEEDIIKIFDALEYTIDQDYVRQHPIGERFVIDFAFVNERIAIEVDGKSHDAKNQKALDIKRDNYLRSNGWVPLRIRDDEFQGYKNSFYKNLIREVVEERRRQYWSGTLYEIEIPNYVEGDY